MIEKYLVIIFMFTGLLLFLWWVLYGSSEARSSNELARLNRIWEEFNQSQDVVNTIIKLEQHSWKYHMDEVKMLYKFMSIIKK